MPALLKYLWNLVTRRNWKGGEEVKGGSGAEKTDEQPSLNNWLQGNYEK
jgi:hypothetical protein